MTREEGLIEKLEKWVKEHPEDADAPHINLTTQREFTIRGILELLIQEKETRVAIVDEEILKIRDEIEKWVGGI
jgi:hypothetical protein